MSASARHRRTKHNGNHGSQSAVLPGRASPNSCCDHDHANDHDKDDAKDHHHMYCRHNHNHHHHHNHSHQTFWEELLSMMMLMIPIRIRRYYYYHPYSKVDLCAIGLVSMGVTLLLVQYVGVMSFLQTTFPDTSKQFQLDREFFDHPHSIPILVVGGTDGSGTRAFVHTLKRLGVLIVADDPHTFDVHASIMFRKLGWPKLITTVLEATNGSVHYEWETLPSQTKIILEREVRKLCLSLAAKYAENKRRIKLAESIRLRPGRTNSKIASMMASATEQQQQAVGVAFAFKAPVAMLVLPLLTKFMGPVKFLHVVRDGRDIALSSNQSPVLKFYNATYPDYQQRTRQFQGDLYPVRGIQLWNDWNVQVYQWSQKTIQSYNTTTHRDKNNHQDISPVLQPSREDKAVVAAQQQQQQETRPAFDYLLMRSEDLIDPSTRFDCFQRLAIFVQSPLTPQELCCLSQLQPEDFGQSTVHSESTNNFAAHPEEWENMGRNANHGRSKLFNFLDSEDDPRNGHGPHIHNYNHNQDVKERMKQKMIMYEEPDVDGDGDMTTTTTTGKIKPLVDQDKHPEEMEALRSEIALKDRTIRVLESKLYRLLGHADKEKEKHLGPKQQPVQPSKEEQPPDQAEQDQRSQEHEMELEQVLVQQQDKIQHEQQQQQERQRRRRLSENNTPPKLVPTMFLKQFSTWQEHVMTNGQELPLPTLQKLLDFGASLQRQYELNASALLSVVPLQEIKDTCHYLQTLIHDRRIRHHDSLYRHHPLGEGGEDEETLAIHERYGKWKIKLEKQPVLSQWLHREGKVGLQLFGYEPRQDWTYTATDFSNNDTAATTSTTTTAAFTCNKQVLCSPPDRSKDLKHPVLWKSIGH